jgi:hypothetical protein
MSERNPFEQKATGFSPGGLRCEQWEDLLTDALDGSLPAADRSAFDAHSEGCTVCGRLLTESRQGLEWLRFLENEPEVPSDLVDRILSKTSGSAAIAAAPAVAGAQIPVHLLGVPVRRAVWDTRMMMTVAMAFFSIALTLNLAGVKLTNLKLSDLTPASMEMNLTRQFYGAKGSLVRYYDNLRLVYEVESKMRDLRKAEEMQQPSQPEQKQNIPVNPQGNGHKNGGKLEPATKMPREGLLWGSPEVAGRAGFEEEIQKAEQDIKKAEEEAEIAVLCKRVEGNSDQAERSLA